MFVKSRSVALVIVSAGYAHAAISGDEKPLHLLIADSPASAWSRPAMVVTTPAAPPKTTPNLAGFMPNLAATFLSPAGGSSRLLFLSPLSPLRAALRLAAEDLATQTLTAFEKPADGSTDAASALTDDSKTTSDPAAKRRDVILRQRRKSVLNEREKTAERTELASAGGPNFDVAGLSGNVELRAMPAIAQVSAAGDQGALPNGSGVVRVSGSISDDLSFAVTGLAAESAATTFRAGAEFELALGDNHRLEVGAVYGTRFQAGDGLLKGEIDQRPVGAVRLVHAMNVLDTVSTRVGGRFIDAPFLQSGRAFDPEVSILVEDSRTELSEGEGRAYLRLDVFGDTLFPGLDVVSDQGDMIALSEGLPVFAADLRSQRTWTRGLAVGYRARNTRLEARLQDQTATDALLVFPSSVSGAPLIENGRRGRLQIGTVSFQKTFAHGQAQAGVEYGYGRFAVDRLDSTAARDFHQITTRFDAVLRKTGTGLAVFHRFHEGAGIAGPAPDGSGAARPSAQRYLIELRQDLPFVPSMMGDMAVLVSLRNVYYDDVDRRNVDEFSVAAPPRRITGGIRVKF